MKILMRIAINTLALFVITGWAIVFFIYKEGGFFHLTLIIGVMALILQWIPNKAQTPTNKRAKIKNPTKGLHKGATAK
ncbi:MAG: hypothetical protein K0S23_1537 [Fluviicola sp.]|uniref:hypothetical protein n=1 Tax=Fluviicola sp. TaxID=1917219 RepID=UPI002620C55F|nr:hypothetical protein [Fluviicola sp.]MDF3027230.1 hypothetical protein [Fluviicola sp.]